MAVCSQDELVDLINNWGSAYLISLAHGQWLAVRRDTEETLTATSADELREAIRRDYRRRPVLRDC
jgi:hypothetical protein